MILAEHVDEISYLHGLVRVKTYCRLIKDEYLRITDKSLGKSDTLSVTFGKVLDNTVLHIGYLESGKCPCHLMLTVCLRNFLYSGNKAEIFDDLHVEIKRRKFRQIAYLLLYLPRVVGHAHAVDKDLAGSRRKISDDHVHGS